MSGSTRVLRAFNIRQFTTMFDQCVKADSSAPPALRAFAEAFLLADYSDQVILWPAATQLAIKYELDVFLKAAENVDRPPEPKRSARKDAGSNPQEGAA